MMQERNIHEEGEEQGTRKRLAVKRVKEKNGK